MLTSDQKVILRELSLYRHFLQKRYHHLRHQILLGGMLSGEGFVTQALLTIQSVRNSYHHWVFKWRWQPGAPDIAGQF